MALPKLQESPVYVLSGHPDMDSETLLKVAEALGCTRTIADSPNGLYYFIKKEKSRCLMR